MQDLSDKKLIETLCSTHQVVLLYFTGSACGACEVIKNKMEKIIEPYENVLGLEVNGEKYPSLAANYGIFTLPYFILFVEGKVTMREGRNVDLLDFERKLNRYVSLLNQREG